MTINYKNRPGAVLLQTLVMSILLAIISVGVTRWILNRHMTATRATRSAEARTTSTGGYMKFVTQNTIPGYSNTNQNLNVNGRNMLVKYTNNNRVVITYEEDPVSSSGSGVSSAGNAGGVSESAGRN